MIIFTEGGKGGVGKSLMASILVHHLTKKGHDVVIIDTDSSNPDVYKAHHKKFTCQLQKIDAINDWAAFLTILDSYKDKSIIVNMPARNQDSIKNWGNTIKEIEENIKVFFMINTQKDSILLLKEYAKVIDPEHIIPTKNLFFGDQDAFSLYDNSSPQKLFEKEFYIEQMISSAADKFYTDRLPLCEIADALNVGDRIFYQRWLFSTLARLSEVF